VTRVGEHLPLSERVERFRRRNPEIRITPPYSGRGKWEVSEPDSPARAYDTASAMLADLEKRYPVQRQADAS